MKKHYLFINTITPEYPSFVIFDDNAKVLAESEFVAKNEGLVYALHNFLEKSAGRKKISAILALNGPGSFSASRAGIILANAFEFLDKIPVLGIYGDGTDLAGILSANIRQLENLKKGARAKVKYQYPPQITIKKNG